MLCKCVLFGFCFLFVQFSFLICSAWNITLNILNALTIYHNLFLLLYYSKQIEEYLTYKSDIIMFRHHHVLTSSCFCIKCFENLHCVFLYVFCNSDFSSWGRILLAEVRPWWCLKSFDNFLQSYLFLALFVAFSSGFVFQQFL